MSVPLSRIDLSIRVPYQASVNIDYCDGESLRPRYSQEIKVLQKPEFGICSCGGMVMYHDDSGVRCISCKKLYGTYNPNFRRKKGNAEPTSAEQGQGERADMVVPITTRVSR